MKLKETDLFDPVSKYLKASDMEVFTEVPVYGRRVDLVGRRDNVITVVELKSSFRMSLLEQAYKMLHVAHYVYICFPAKSSSSVNEFGKFCARKFGIGILIYKQDEGRVIMIEQAKLCRKIIFDWNRILSDDYKPENNVPGGWNGGGYMTQYKRMINRVVDYLETRDDFVSITDLLDYVDLVELHYANPKKSLYKALTEYEKSWFECKVINGISCFRIREGVKAGYTFEGRRIYER